MSPRATERPISKDAEKVEVKDLQEALDLCDVDVNSETSLSVTGSERDTEFGRDENGNIEYEGESSLLRYALEMFERGGSLKSGQVRLYRRKDSGLSKLFREDATRGFASSIGRNGEFDRFSLSDIEAFDGVSFSKDFRPNPHSYRVQFLLDAGSSEPEANEEDWNDVRDNLAGLDRELGADLSEEAAIVEVRENESYGSSRPPEKIERVTDVVQSHYHDVKVYTVESGGYALVTGRFRREDIEW